MRANFGFQEFWACHVVMFRADSQSEIGTPNKFPLETPRAIPQHAGHCCPCFKFLYLRVLLPVVPLSQIYRTDMPQLQLAGWLVGRPVAGWLAEWPPGCLTGWLAGRLAGLRVDGGTGWLARLWAGWRVDGW